MRWMKKLLIGIVLYLGIFGVACLVVFYIKGNEPSALIAAVFSSAAVELLISGAIKVLEKKSDKESDGNENE